MSKPAMIERDLLVFSIWAVLGFGGLAFLLEGFSRDSYFVSLAGIAAIIAGFIAHMVVNAVFDCGFKPGETALGISSFGVLALAFISGWISGGLSMNDYWSGLTLFVSSGVWHVDLPFHPLWAARCIFAFPHKILGKSKGCVMTSVAFSVWLPLFTLFYVAVMLIGCGGN